MALLHMSNTSIRIHVKYTLLSQLKIKLCTHYDSWSRTN